MRADGDNRIEANAYIKGVGEVPLVPGMAAIRNAVYGAIGIRFYHLPMSPPKVLDALEPDDMKLAADD